MKLLKTNKENENPLFKRKEIILEINSTSAPSYEETLEFLSKKYSTQPENIRVKSIKGKFGSQDFTITANLYDSEQNKILIEGEYKKEKELAKKKAEAKAKEEAEKKEKEEAAKAEAEKPEENSESKEETKEEKPAEEIKEEKNA